MSFRKSLFAVALAAAAALPALHAQERDQFAGGPKIDPAWLSWNPATNTVKFALVAGAPGGKSPFNFNGYTDGELTLVVPEGTTVVMPFVNDDGVPHSAGVVSADKPLPNMWEEAAIPRAYTRKALEGLNQGEKDTIRFTARPGGKYWIFCGVPGHGLSGMYIGLVVDPSAKEPKLLHTPKAAK